MNVFRIRNHFFPLRILASRRLMSQAPRWPADRLSAWSRERRRRIVEHAARTVPHYRDTFARLGIDPSTADREEIWERIPTVSKEELRDDPERFVSSAAGRHGGFWAGTSGSTGMPLKILLDDNVNIAAFALFWRAWGSGGHWRLGQRHLVLKGSTHASGWAHHRAIRALEISSSHLAAGSVQLLRDRIDRYRPRFVRGYPSALYLLCRLLRQEGLELRIPMVISGSETLHDFQREEIERTLGARLYNHYTHWERAVSVLECERGMLHAQEDYGHHEILGREGRPVPEGAAGEITGTGLHNLAMPLIRYRTGDVATWSSRRCDCGQSFPVMERILGRQTDYVVRADGSLVPGTSVTAAFKSFPRVLYAQVLQERPGAVELRLVPDAGYRDGEDTREILSLLRSAVGEEMTIEVRRCGLGELERSPAGKIRSCRSRAARPG